MNTTVKLDEKAGTITVTMPYDAKGRVSSTGKALLHATANDKFALPSGEQVRLNCNVYTKNPAYKDKK